MRPWCLGLGLFVALAGSACTVKGEDVMTTFSDPTANPSGTPPTSGSSQTDGDSASSGTGGGGTADSSGGPSTDPTGDPTTDPTNGSTGAPPDEQPDDGMYSGCASVADCVGFTTCVSVPGAMPLGGYCSNTGCANPAVDCEPNFGATSTAVPECVTDNNMAMVCALGCGAGQTCPGGMECLPLGATMVCA